MAPRLSLPRTLRKCITGLVCSSLLMTTIAPFRIANAGRVSFLRARAQESASPARAAVPEGTLPNLDEARNQQLPRPVAPSSIPSTLRSRKNPLARRTVLRVGDPLPLPSILPSPSRSPQPSPAPSMSPIASPSFWPTPVPSPSISPFPLALVSAGGAKATWTDNGEESQELLRYLLAWNSQPTFLQSGNTVFRSAFSDSSQPYVGGLSEAAFDFFLMPIPQAGSARIVFVSNREGRAQIYSMDVNGSNLIRLTNNGSNDDQPRWSPNGTKILFQSDRDSTPPSDPENPGTTQRDIYVMNADGSGQTRLTTGAADDCNAEWSPDGTKIIFQSLRNGAYYQVYSMNADGSSQLNVSNGVTADNQPSWSPNGSQIAFASERDHAGAPGVYVMNANGSNQTRLTFTSAPFRDEQPVWSRDGMKVAFVSTRDSVVETWQETDDDGGLIQKSAIHTNKEIYLMNADGSNQVRLTNTLENDDSPCWSPDNTKIVFRSEREREAFDPTPQLWTMNTDGTNQAAIADNVFGDSSPGWTANAAGNQSPIANSGGPYTGLIAQNVAFSGAGSFDPDGTIASYLWSFGDGGTGSGITPTHAYATAGTYNISLTVTDNLGAPTTANTTATITTAGSEPYLANFNQFALGRAPYQNESTYWNDILRAAYPNGQASMILAVRELGKTLFESSVYAARNRDNHWYVYDLYKTYLMREPDAPGWAYWESAVPGAGRENVRRAFDECGEFASIIATLRPTGSPSSTVSSLASARVDPFNQPGNGLAARDAEWSVSLLSLPGRAGLDLGLSLSYSSMVWTHSGPYIYFDEDNDWPSPGFRLGFPAVQERVFDAQAGRNVYLLIAGGSRVSLRQLGTSNVYEASDSSYLQLIDYGGSLLVRTTDGTQLTYQSFNNEWRCTQIKDRNGNYISVNYDWLGHITTIIDTLERTITFNYDTNANLTSITQPWTVNGASQTHTWASFGWSTKTILPSFSSVMAGATPLATIAVVNQMGLDDGSRSTFEYNQTGQASLIRNYRSDNIQRAYAAYDYDAPTDDCPRLIGTRVSAENWTAINGVPSEAVTQYADPGDGSHTVTTPDGTLYKEFYGVSHKRGLVTQSEVWSAGIKQKWTTNDWTQDNTAVNYQTNPRVTETNIFDATGNRRRATVSYAQFTLPSGALCSLPSDTREYAADAVTILRRTHVDYRMDPNLDATYLDRHIIGLVKEQTLYQVSGGAETPKSKVGFGYDEAGSIQGAAAPVRHDNDNYGATFVAGRANLSSVKRYDVDVPDFSVFTVSGSKYNTAGAVVSQTDPLSHQTTVNYADSFSDNNNSRNTLAYPTSITDPDLYSSTVTYNFDFGAATRKQTPQPNTIQNIPGPVQTMAYDAAGRIERVTATTNNAYQRYVYGPNYVQSFTTVNNVTDEAYSITVFDGLGRTFLSGRNHPGSSGTYAGQHTIYDSMGRAIKQSNPTEITSTWQPSGDDVAGWLYTQQTYDWKGRPRITTNTDGTTKEANYIGCGCAGGEVTTLTDEGTIDSGMLKRRQQKIYSDILGRTVKTEVLNWEGGSVYNATVNTYNARDQVTLTRQYQGPEGSATYQDTTLTYDGYARLKTRHVPEQGANAVTTYNYNADDTSLSVVDARGASKTYTYNNNRKLVTGISYAAPGSIPTLANVSFAYDAAGNRTSMTDGFGSQTYQYDQLSRLTSETRTITGVGTYPLSYAYNLSGELTSITDSFNAGVGYSYDSVGRVSNVTGANFAGVPTYASNLQYRASGGLKHLDFGNNLSLALTYNSRLQPASFTVAGVTSVMNKTYDYQPDGRRAFSHDLIATKFDRSYKYDHAGRITEALSGPEARNEGTSNQRPYKQTFAYDALGHMIERPANLLWSLGGGAFSPLHQDYHNERNMNWQYDADGNLTDSGEVQYTMDAAGQTARSVSVAMSPFSHPDSTVWGYSDDVTQGFDGDGQVIKKVGAETTIDYTQGNSTTTTITYFVRSSVLQRQVITEISETGQKQRTFVYLGSKVLAWQRQNPDSSQAVLWEHRDTGNASYRVTASGGIIVSSESAELDPLGNNARTTDPISLVSLPKLSLYPSFGDGATSGDGMCSWDGMPIPCDAYAFALNSGYINDPAQQRGLHQQGGLIPLYPDYDYRGQEKRPFNFRFDNAAEYGDYVDTWSSPLWVVGTRERGNGQLGEGFFAHAPQDPNDRKINYAFGDASTAISRKKGQKKDLCTDFFTQGRTLEEVSAIFANFWKNAFHDPNLPATASTANSGQGMGASVRFGNAFFADDDTTPGTDLSWSFANNIYLTNANQLSPRQNRALTVLHEFAHALGLLPSDNPTVDPSGKQSTANDATIYKNCGYILDRLPLRD